MANTDLLFVGDIHIGRRPSGLDDQLQQLRRSPQSLSPEVALERTVDYALDSDIRAVVFTGDLIENERDQFRGRLILAQQIRRLAEAGVQVVAVAGNHDSEMLPRVVDEIDHCHLLGRGGRWECVSVDGPGQPVDLIGWSFPSRHFRQVPLDVGDFESARAKTRANARTIGVLHCDLDQAQSNYAPVSRARLESTALDAWMLGHVHMPGDLSGNVPIGYLGSLVGLDIGETGARGPWRVSASASGIRCEQLALGPIRWERVEVDLSDLETGDSQETLTHVLATLEQAFEADESMGSRSVEVVIARVVLTGNPASQKGPHSLAEEGHRLPPERLRGLDFVIESVRDETRPPINLQALSKQPTPLGQVATTIMALENGDIEKNLKHRADRVVERVAKGGWGLSEKDYPLPDTNQALLKAAWRVLDQMLQQRECDR